jgi:aspartate aminotransferase-like enzyme
MTTDLSVMKSRCGKDRDVLRLKIGGFGKRWKNMEEVEVADKRKTAKGNVEDENITSVSAVVGKEIFHPSFEEYCLRICHHN